MTKRLVALAALVLLLSACQKEPSFEDPNSVPGGGGTGGGTGGGGSTGTKLVKIGSRAGADTVTTTYSYNAANFLMRFVQSGTISGITITADLRLVRNASNIITSSIVKSDEILAQFGVDSVEVFHFYDAANSRYKYSISPVISFGGSTETDSTVYNYTSGKVTSIISYNNDGSGYIPEGKTEFAYAGNNLLEEKTYSYNPGTSAYELDEVSTYEYDAKTNPTQFVADAPVTSINLFYSANNQTKRTVVQTGTPAVVVATGYTYSGTARPQTATTTSGGAVTSVSNYTYQ